MSGASAASSSGHPPPLQEDDEDVAATTSLAPSHITPDGHFVHLPPPGPRERRQYFERSIARYKLLQEDLNGSKPSTKRGSAEERAEEDGGEATEDEEGGDFDDAASERGPQRKSAAGTAMAAAKKDDATMKVHPLALASAKIQASGLNELNRAINLSGLVSTGEYFGMANVVDPALVADQSASSAAASVAAGSKEKPVGGAAAGPAAPATAAAVKGGHSPGGSAGANDEDQRVRSLYVLKRKRSQLARAAHSLHVHGSRLRAGIVAQARPDARLRQLRRHWRLVAPEHGTRALPHPARPTEVVAVDVDVYYNRGSATSSSSLLSAGPPPNGRGDDQAFGRLTSRVPRYATLELMDEYKYESDLERWERRFQKKEVPRHDEGDAMDVEEADKQADAARKEDGEDDERIWTVAEPFAIADPTLGKVDVDFDPTRATTMLSLQFDIEKASTGFRQSALLRSMASSTNADSTIHPDEELLFTLQHSLFAAKLFESIRREIAPDTDEIGAIRPVGAAKSSGSGGNQHSSAWITQESDVNFLPPPTLMSGVGSGSGDGLVPLCVVHCHEGEVQVQLDCEYTLRVKLVEADGQQRHTFVGKGSEEGANSTKCPASQDAGPALSGSQTPEQLLLLCRTLLYHAEERYHEHSQRRALESQAWEIANARDAHLRKPEVRSPRILQSCVSLGSKLLMEERVRVALSGVQEWLRRRQPPNLNGGNGNQGNDEDVLTVTWLSLSVLDLHSQFTMSFRHWVADAVLVGEEITVTSTTPVLDVAALDHPDGNGGAATGSTFEYRKAKFHSVEQLVLHLKLILRRMLKAKS